MGCLQDPLWLEYEVDSNMSFEFKEMNGNTVILLNGKFIHYYLNIIELILILMFKGVSHDLPFVPGTRFAGYLNSWFVHWYQPNKQICHFFASFYDKARHCMKHYKEASQYFAEQMDTCICK